MDATSVFDMNSDAAYSLLYQNKTMVELLLRSWAPPDVADDINYSTLREESPKHYDGEGHLRVGDLVWSFRMRSGQLVWAAILLEFQSTPDLMLPWRLLSYASLFWRRVESAGRLQDGKLPALLPIVLYSGSRPWNVSQHMADCVSAPEGSSLRTYAPRMPYLVVDVQRQDRSRLEGLDHPVAWAMLLEQAHEDEEVRRLVTKMDEWGRATERRAAWAAFGVLLREIVAAGRAGAGGLQYGTGLTEEERKMSLAENFDRWKQQWVEEGVERGREEGRREGELRGLERGRQEGEQLGVNRGLRFAVQSALTARFGTLGTRFWDDHLAVQDIGPWSELLTAILRAQTLDDLHRFRTR
jgi:predicted transposase YdaD